MDMDQVQRKDINNLMNESLSKELDIHIGEYDEESKEYTFNINPFNYATVECNNWIMDFDELSKSYVPSGDSIIFLFNDKVKLSELSLKHISKVVLSFTAENCIVESIGFGSSVIDFVEVNSSGDVSVSLDLSKYSVNELVKLFSDDLFSIVVVLSNDLNESYSVLKDWNLQFTFKDLLLDEKEATKNRIEEFTESTYLKKEEIIDTGWLDLPLTNDFLPYNDTLYKPMYRCIGGLVFIKGAVKPKKELKPTSVNDFYVISNLPSNCRLNGEVTTFVKHGSGYNLFSLEIRSSKLGFGRYATGETLTTSISNTAWININCCYCIDDIVLGMINNIIESVGDYNTLNNKPSLNGQTLIGDTVLNIPTNTSDLVNDSDYITSSYHDNTKVDKITGKGLSSNDYTIIEKNKLASLENYDDTDVKSDIQDLVTGKADKLSTYTKSETDSVVSDATNDMATETWVNSQGFLTTAPVISVNGKTGSVILTPSDLGLGSVFKVKGSKPTKNDLPLINNEIGDVWYVIDESVGYIWLNDGTTTRWEQLGLEIDLSNYTTITNLNQTLLGYVQKVTGKDLSSNDFTTALKTKLEGLSNYDDSEIRSLINGKVDKVTGKQLSTNDYSNSEKSKLASQNNSWFGTCSTASATASKVVTIDDSNFELRTGTIIGVKFSKSNTASNVTLNVNGTGAKQIWYSSSVYTSNANTVCGYANRTNYYMFNGTYWVFLHNGVVDSNTTYYPTISASHYSTETIRDNATTSSYNNIWSTTPTRNANYSTFTRTTSNVGSYCKSAPININDTVIIDFDYVHDNTNVTNKIFHFYGTDSSGAEKVSSLTNGNTLGLTKDAHITIVTNNKGVGYYVDGRAVTWVSYARPVTQYFRFGINAANVTLSFKNYKQRKVNNVELSEIIDGKQDVISDLTTIRNGANKGSTAIQPNDDISKLNNDVGYLTSHQDLSGYYTKEETNNQINNHHDSLKQDVISDLTTIRAGANKGATSLQPSSTLYESKLVWGNEVKNNSITPLDMATYSEFNANRLAYLPSECITIEYSTDGGSTWSDYGATDTQKTALVTTSNTFFVGGSSSAKSVDGRLRVTIDNTPNTSTRVYLLTRKLLIYLSTNGTTGNKCLVETSKFDAPNDYSTIGEYNVSGYAGWNSIPINFRFGQANQTQTTQIRKLRLTFRYTNVGTSNNTYVNRIRLFGESCWNPPSQLANDGHMYSIDTNKKSKFIGDVEATKLIKSGGTASQFLKADGSIDSSTYMKETDLQAMVNNLATAINNI